MLPNYLILIISDYIVFTRFPSQPIWSRAISRATSLSLGTVTEAWVICKEPQVSIRMQSSMLIHVDVWQNPPQYCKVISLQLKSIYQKKKKKNAVFHDFSENRKDLSWVSVDLFFFIRHGRIPPSITGVEYASQDLVFVSKVNHILHFHPLPHPQALTCILTTTFFTL